MKSTRLLTAAFLCFASCAALAQTPNLTFTVKTTTQGGTAVVPELTWSTTPAGATCQASALPIAPDWTGVKAASGTVVLAAINATRSYTLACNWPGDSQAIVSWVNATTNTDGSAYTNPKAIKVYWNTGPPANVTAPNAQTKLVTPPTLTSTTITGLAPGTWNFCVASVNALDFEALCSNVASKTLTAGGTQSRTLEVAVKFPNPPTGVTVE